MNNYLVIITCLWSICAGISIIIYGIMVLRWYIHTLSNNKKYEVCKDIKKAIDKKDSFFKKEISVTILICARNEAINLARFIPEILRQYIPKHVKAELLIVDDASEDNTWNVIEDLRKTYYKKRILSKRKRKNDKQNQTKSLKSTQKVTLISVFFKKGIKKYIKYLDISFSFRNLHIHNKNNIGKKFALAAGIDAASSDFILVTDADCYPNSRYWLSGMLERQTEQKDDIDFVLGYSPYAKTKPQSFLNKWIRFEALFTLCQYATAAHWKLPYMGVGRNMLYKRSVFTESYQWEKHKDLVSGDDDLFVNAQANKENTCLSLHPDTWIYSLPSISWKSYFRQKTRHFTTGTRYQWKHKILLGLWTQSHVWFWLLSPSICLLVSNSLFYLFLSVFLFRILLFTVVCSLLCRTFSTKELVLFIPLFDIGLVIYYILFAPILMLNINLKTWN